MSEEKKFICEFCGREFSSRVGNTLHQRCCYMNPDKVITGVSSTPEKEEERKRKISETMKANKKSGGLRKGSGRGKKGWYKGIQCDSTYELVWVIYNIDHCIQFKRNTTIYYEYEYKGKLHKYYPDFLMPDNSLVEIKGYHTEVVDIKLNSVSDRKINIYYYNDIKYMFDYIKDVYNKDEISIVELYDSRIKNKHDINNELKLKENEEQKKIKIEKIRLSGIFYRAYILEKQGVDIDFTSIVNNEIGNKEYKSNAKKSSKKVITDRAREYSFEYSRWKSALC